MATLEEIRADFDRIALVEGEAPPYLDRIAALLPERIGAAVEIGCGSGRMTAILAARARRVLAVDLAPNMVAAARARLAGAPHVEVLCADANAVALDEGAFEVAVTIATLHHLPFEPTLARLARALAPGGLLVVHDLFRERGLVDRAASALALPLSFARRLLVARPSPEARAAWAAHARHDRFLTLDEVRRRAAAVLPGARVRRHLLWRYTLTWRKPLPERRAPAPSP